jgi:hypothetical protein
VKLCSDLQLRNAPRKIVHRAAGRGAGRPDLLLPHLHKVLLEPVLRPLAVVGRVACALCAGLFPCSYLSYSPLPTVSFMACPAWSPNTIPALVAHWWLIFADMCPFVLVYGSEDCWDSLERKNQ